MENQNPEKSRLVFPEQFNGLFQKNMFPEALTLAEERLKDLPMDADAYVAAGRAQIAMALMEESRRMLHDLESKIFALTDVFARMGELYAEKGYPEDARLCYHKFIAFNPSSPKSRESARQKPVREEVNHVERKTDHRDHVPSSDYLIRTLSEWLANIHRIKTHAANHQ